MSRTRAPWRSATQPSMKKVARTPAYSRISSRRSVVSTTRLSSVGHSSGRRTRANASAWKYSSMSNVSAFFTRSHLGEQAVLLVLGVGPDHPLQAGDERHARAATQHLLGERDARAGGGELAGA